MTRSHGLDARRSTMRDCSIHDRRRLDEWATTSCPIDTSVCLTADLRVVMAKQRRQQQWQQQKERTAAAATAMAAAMSTSHETMRSYVFTRLDEDVWVATAVEASAVW